MSNRLLWCCRVGALGLVLLCGVSSAAAQDAQVTELARETTTAGFPLVHALRVEAGPALDGEILSDPVWAEVAPVGGFVQSTPDEGEAASERTEIRVVYTADTLYFGAVLYDSDPSTITVADSRRDSSLDETDSLQIILDTFLDRQNGFVFGTSPSGLEFDGQVTNEGQGSGRFGGGGGGGRPGSGQQRGSGGGFNQNWDGAWQVRTSITEVGWTAEFAIPFRTLRFNSGEVQAWGLNLPAEHPQAQRDRVLVAIATTVQPVSAVPGGPAGRARPEQSPQPEADALRAGAGDRHGGDPR